MPAERCEGGNEEVQDESGASLNKGWNVSSEEKEMDISKARRSGTLLSSNMKVV